MRRHNIPGAVGLLAASDFGALMLGILAAGMGALADRKPTPHKPSPSRSAAINRWTNMAHEHTRAKARRLRQIGAA